jgi:hypothetical protein
MVQSQPRQIVHEPYLKKTDHRKGLAEWLKVRALSSNPSTTHTHTQNFETTEEFA